MVIALLASSAFAAQPPVLVRWGPEQWVPIIVAMITSMGAIVAAIVASLHSRSAKAIALEVVRQIKVPSNGVSAGAVLEGIVHVQQIQGQLLTLVLDAKKMDIPNAIDYARKLGRED